MRGPHSVENVQGALFVLTTENTFPALYGALAVFPGEWPVFEREARAGLYGPTAYYVSKVVALVRPFSFFLSFFFHLGSFLCRLDSPTGR